MPIDTTSHVQPARIRPVHTSPPLVDQVPRLSGSQRRLLRRTIGVAEDYLESGFAAMTHAKSVRRRPQVPAASPSLDLVVPAAGGSRFEFAGWVWKKGALAELDVVTGDVVAACEPGRFSAFVRSRGGRTTASDRFFALSCYMLTAVPVLARAGQAARAVDCCTEIVTAVLNHEQREAAEALARGGKHGSYRGLEGFGAGRSDIEKADADVARPRIVNTPYIGAMPMTLSLGVWAIEAVLGPTLDDRLDGNAEAMDPTLAAAIDQLLAAWPITGYCNPQALISLALVTGRFRIDWAREVVDLFGAHHRIKSSRLMNSTSRLLDELLATPAS